MTTKEKPTPGWHREAGYDTAFDSRNNSSFHARPKALLVGIAAYDAALLALWGLLPAGLASWFIQRGGTAP